MLRLKTFGQALCEIGQHRITPAAELQFALLLYLGAHAGKAVPRRRLASVLWGEQAAAEASHRLRQALYILRKLGLELEVSRDTLLLRADQVESDFAVFASSAAETADLSAVQGEFLPVSHRIFSAEFDEWVEGQRRIVGAAVLRQALAAVREARDTANWHEVMRYARLGLRFDSLNEEAHLALAEALASTGSKGEAIRLLKTYETEIGSLSSDAKVPAVRLRERVAAIRESPPRTVFVGRQHELAVLAGALLTSQSARTQIVGIVGEAGIGKTTLVSEFLRRAVLSVQSKVVIGAEQFDRDKPLGTILQLLRKLLALPGAMGTSPECLAHLRNLIGDAPSDRLEVPSSTPPALVEHRIAEQIEELLDAICDEEPLTIIVENVHNVDVTSLQLLTSTRMMAGARRLLIVVTGRESAAVRELKEQRGLTLLALAPLSREDAQRLASATGVEITAAQAEEWFTLTGGNPYFLEQLLRGSWSESRESLPTSVSALIQHRLAFLTPLATRTLQLCALLGRYSELSRVELILREPRTAVISAIEELERLEMVRSTEAGALQCAHDLLREGALRRLTSSSRRFLHLMTGEQLAREYEVTSDPAVAWDAAAHLGDAGKHTEAASLLSACANELLRVGLAEHAADLLRRALTSSTAASSRQQLTRQLIDLYRRTLQWDEVAALLTTLPSAEQRQGASHIELTLVAIEESLSHLADPTELLDRLDILYQRGTATPQLRLRAARLGLTFAYDCLCMPAAALWHARAIDVATQQLADHFELQRAKLFYEWLFGSCQQAVVLACEHLYDARRSGDIAQLCSTLRICANALGEAGYVDAAVLARTESQQIAKDINLLSMASWGCLGEALHKSIARDWEGAMRALHESDSFAHSRNAWDRVWRWQCEGAVVLGTGDAAHARALLRQRTPVSGNRNRRVAMNDIAFEQLLREIGYGEAIDPRLLPQLEQHYAVICQRGGADIVFYALWRLYMSAGQEVAATALAEHYALSAREHPASCLSPMADIVQATVPGARRDRSPRMLPGDLANLAFGKP